MNITAFLKNILPTFGKKDVREKLRLISSKLSEIIRPSVESTVEGLDERKAKSTFFKVFIRTLQSSLGPTVRNSQTPFKLVTLRAIDTAQRLVDMAETYVSKNLQETIHIEGSTYQSAYVLRLLELLDFFADYTIRNLNVIVASETNIAVFEKPDINPTTPAEMKWLLENRDSYIKVVELLAGDAKQIMASIEKLPEIALGDTDPQLNPALAGAAGDPLRMGGIPIISDIFHGIGIRLVNYELDRYERCLKDKQVIEMRLETLSQRNNGNLDAQTETVIDGYDRNLVLLRKEINDYKERAR